MNAFHEYSPNANIRLTAHIKAVDARKVRDLSKALSHFLLVILKIPPNLYIHLPQRMLQAFFNHSFPFNVFWSNDDHCLAIAFSYTYWPYTKQLLIFPPLYKGAYPPTGLPCWSSIFQVKACILTFLYNPLIVYAGIWIQFNISRSQPVYFSLTTSVETPLIKSPSLACSSYQCTAASRYYVLRGIAGTSSVDNTSGVDIRCPFQYVFSEFPL